MIKYVTLITLYLFCLLANSYAQIKRLDNLTLEGAGIRGIAYGGALKVLEQKGLLQQVKRISGSSAGAITATLLSVGYTATEIETIIGKTNFKKFNDGGFPIIGGLRRLVHKFGYYKGDKFEKYLQNLIAAKTGNASITFSEIAAKYKALYLTGTSLSQQKVIIFSADNYPNMPVCNAVRVSMSIPLYYKAVCIDSQGLIVRNPKVTDKVQVMIDGGFTNDYPIQIFDSTKFITPNNPNTFAVNPYTIGLRVDVPNQIALDKNPYNTTLAPIEVKNIGNYGNAFMLLLLEGLNRHQLTPDDWKRTISIPDGGISPKVRKMKPSEITLLRNNGITAATQYFALH